MKCDGNRPYCSQCLIIGRPCGGYRLDQTFVPYQPTVRKRGSGKVSPDAVQFNQGEAQRSPSSDLKMTHGSLIGAHTQNSQRYPIPRPIDTPTLEEFTAVILSCFIAPGSQISSTLPVGAIQTCGAWVEVLPRLAVRATPQALIFSAVKAFGTAILATGPHAKYVDYQCIGAYHTALRQLKNFLLAPKEFFHLETAASIACLAMVEVNAHSLVNTKPSNDGCTLVNVCNVYHGCICPHRRFRRADQIVSPGFIQFRGPPCHIRGYQACSGMHHHCRIPNPNSLTIFTAVSSFRDTQIGFSRP